MNPEQEFGPQQAPLMPEAPRAFDIGDVLNNPGAVQKNPALYNPPGTENYTKQELDVARQIKEQGGGREDFLKEIEAIRNEEYPTEAKEDAGLPDLATKEEINKEASTLHNFAAGSATGLLETVGLAGSALEFGERVDSSALNILYKNLPTELQSQLKQYLPENVTRENIFEGTLKPLEEFSELKDQAQIALGANPDATATTVGEFLTPDTWLGVGALLKGGVKLAPKVVNGVRTNIGDIAEYFVKLSSGLRREGIELDLKLLKSNPKLALEKSGIQPDEIVKMLDEIIVQLPKNATKELDQIENIKSELTSTILQKQGDDIAKATQLGDEVSVTLESTAFKAKTNLAKQADELQLTGAGYEKFIGQESRLTAEGLKTGFINNIKKADPLMGDVGRQALKEIEKEVDIIVQAVSKRDGIFRYEDLHKLRKNIDKRINWGDVASSEKNAFIKSFRKTFDEDVMAKEFDGLKTLDEKYATKIGEIENMQKVFGKGGEESSAFRKKLISLHKFGNDLEIEKTANLLGIDSIELKTLSKNLADDVASSTKKISVDPQVTKIDNIENFEGLNRTIKEIGGKNLSELKKLSIENSYMDDFVKAIEADSVKAGIKTSDNLGENLVATIFKTLEAPRGTSAGNKADVALAYIEKQMGEKAFQELKVIKSLYKIKGISNEGTFASLAFNLASVKAGGLAPVLRAFVKTPEEGLQYVLKRAVRTEKRKIEAIAKKARAGKPLLSEEVTELAELLIKYDFGAKTTGNILDNE